MSIYSASVKRPITTILIFVAIVVLGLFSVVSLPIDLYPEIEMNRIMVMTAYPGASAADIETNVTKPLENTLNGVGDLKHITSSSKENISVISLEFNEGIDIDVATNDVRDKLDAVTGRLPDDVDKPIIFKFGPDDIPVAILVAEATSSTKALYKILDEKVANPLQRISGIGAVSVSGADIREILVYCDPVKLEAYNLSISQIGRVIAMENSNIPSGQVDIGSNTKNIRVQGEFVDPEQMLDLVVGSYQGQNVFLHDVAHLEDTSQERQQEVYTNGVRGATVIINKQSGANSVQISNAVKKALPEIQKTLPSDVKLNVIVDTSDEIRNTISSLTDTIAITFLVVVFVVFFFLTRWRATFIIAITIPISLIGSFIYLKLTGGTLNIISMSSLSIAIGMVVDDAIVVLENITTHIERGSYPKQAAVHATNEVGISVVASTLTMLAVFLPLTLVQGMTGVLFQQLGWIVSIIMIISTVAALSLTPTLAAQMMKRRTKVSPLIQKVFGPTDRALGATDRAYGRLLHWCVRHRVFTLVICVLVFFGSLLLSPLIKSEFFPQSDNSYITAELEYPVGTRMEISRELAAELQERWRAEHPEIKRVNFTVGQADTDNAFASMRSNGSHIISFNISLVDPEFRSRKMGAIADDIRTSLAEYPELQRFKVVAGGQGGGMGGQQQVDIEIYGHDFQKTDLLAQELKERLLTLPSCSEVNISRKDYVPEIQIDFDRVKLAENGLSVAAAGDYVRNAFNGMQVGYFREDGDEYKIRVPLSPEARESIESIENLMLYNPMGHGIRLRELGDVVERETPPTIERKDRERVVTVSGVVAPGKVLSELVDASKEEIEKVEFPDGVSYKIGGIYEEQQKSFQALYTLMVLIIILVFIVMAAQFESLTDPFVIMFSIPFAFTGVFIGLVMTNTPLSVMALVGLLILLGIVVKNGIVLIDYTRLCRERGMSVLESVVRAGHSRLRPVLMTTATTVLGMMPMAIGIGQGSELWQPMGITVAFGLTVSTLVTLVLIPTLYATFSAVGVKRERRRASKKRERRRREEELLIEAK